MVCGQASVRPTSAAAFESLLTRAPCSIAPIPQRFREAPYPRRLGPGGWGREAACRARGGWVEQLRGGPILKAGNKSSRNREEERSPRSVVSSFQY